jgi:hypothetical protein
VDNIFETNSLINIKKEIFHGSNIFTMDNFFKNPDAVVDYIYSHKAELFKRKLKRSYNGSMFFDKRHTILNTNFLNLQKKLTILRIGKPADPSTILTNCFTMIEDPFNDYENNYWRPHRDLGYTCLIYLNKSDVGGTNLYDDINTDIKGEHDNAHYAPWRAKKDYTLIKTIPATYNKMVIFDAKKFLHGMEVSNNSTLNEERINIVIFYQ